MDEIKTKVITVFILAIHRQPLTVSTFQLLYTVKEEGEIPDRKPYPLPYALINPRLCPETSTKVYVHEFGFSTVLCN